LQKCNNLIYKQERTWAFCFRCRLNPFLWFVASGGECAAVFANAAIKAIKRPLYQTPHQAG
jgi:hypothetical protein